MFRRTDATDSPASGSKDDSPSGLYSPSDSSSSSSSAGSSYAPARPSAATGDAPKSPATPINPYRPMSGADSGASRPRGELKPSVPTNTSSADKPKATRRILTVGNDILLKGEISTCDRLLIEGKVDAKISDVHTVEIAETGSFKGQAEVEDAEISGTFEGDLIVRNRLVIYATGKVSGNITYGEIEIERGGQITGAVKTITGAGSQANPKSGASSKSERSGLLENAA